MNGPAVLLKWRNTGVRDGYRSAKGNYESAYEDERSILPLQSGSFAENAADTNPDLPPVFRPQYQDGFIEGWNNFFKSQQRGKRMASAMSRQQRNLAIGAGVATVAGVAGGFTWYQLTKPLTVWKRSNGGAVSGLHVDAFDAWVIRAKQRQSMVPVLRLWKKGNFPEDKTYKLKLATRMREPWAAISFEEAQAEFDALTDFFASENIPVSAMALRTTYDKERELLSSVSNQRLRVEMRPDLLEKTTAARRRFDQREQAAIYGSSVIIGDERGRVKVTGTGRRNRYSSIYVGDANGRVKVTGTSGTLSLDSGALLPRGRTRMRQSMRAQRIDTGRDDDWVIGGTGSHALRGERWAEVAARQGLRHPLSATRLRGERWAIVAAEQGLQHPLSSKGMRVHAASGTLSLDSGALLPKGKTRMRQ